MELSFPSPSAVVKPPPSYTYPLVSGDGATTKESFSQFQTRYPQDSVTMSSCDEDNGQRYCYSSNDSRTVTMNTTSNLRNNNYNSQSDGQNYTFSVPSTEEILIALSLATEIEMDESLPEQEDETMYYEFINHGTENNMSIKSSYEDSAPFNTINSCTDTSSSMSSQTYSPCPPTSTTFSPSGPKDVEHQGQTILSLDNHEILVDVHHKELSELQQGRGKRNSGVREEQKTSAKRTQWINNSGNLTQEQILPMFPSVPSVSSISQSSEAPAESTYYEEPLIGGMQCNWSPTTNVASQESQTETEIDDTLPFGIPNVSQDSWAGMNLSEFEKFLPLEELFRGWNQVLPEDLLSVPLLDNNLQILGNFVSAADESTSTTSAIPEFQSTFNLNNVSSPQPQNGVILFAPPSKEYFNADVKQPSKSLKNCVPKKTKKKQVKKELPKIPKMPKNKNVTLPMITNKLPSAAQNAILMLTDSSKESLSVDVKQPLEPSLEICVPKKKKIKQIKVKKEIPEKVTLLPPTPVVGNEPEQEKKTWIISCKICGSKLQGGRQRYEAHIKNCHEWFCDCGEMFTSKALLQKHIELVSKMSTEDSAVSHGIRISSVVVKPVFECDLCNQVFRTTGSAKKHRKTVHSIDEIIGPRIALPKDCSHCQENFNLRKDLKAHIKVCPVRLQKMYVKSQEQKAQKVKNSKKLPRCKSTSSNATGSNSSDSVFSFLSEGSTA